MKKLRLLIAALFVTSLMSFSVMAAEVRIGVSAGFAHIEASGSETLKDSAVVTAHTEQTNAIIPSFFAELAMDNGLGIGYDYISADPDLAASERSNTLTATTDDNTSDTGTNKANASIDKLSTVYLIKTFESGFLVKAGLTGADVTTKETLASGSTYGNKSVDGKMFGIGYGAKLDSGVFFRTAIEVTDYDTLNLTSGVADAVTGTTNTIKADIDTTVAKFSVGKAF
jgi:hypothetical protein